MKLSGRERYMMIGGGIIAGVVVVVNWLALPLYRSWAELGEQLAPKLALLEKLEDRVDRRDALLARRARLSRQMGSLLGQAENSTAGKNNKKPHHGSNPGHKPEAKSNSQPEPRSLEVEIAEMAKKSGAKLQLVYSRKTSRRARELKYFREVALHVEASGKAGSIAKMLHRLEKGQRLIRVDSFELHRKPDDRSPVNITLEVVAYTAAAQEGGS